jgi:L-threonylcarbamoyladenylate synthase
VILRASGKDGLSAEALESLRALDSDLGRGALFVYPTDTLYALGCRATDIGALRALRSLKRRDDTKPLPLIAASPQQLEPLGVTAFADGPRGDARALRLAESLWPGPLTLIVPAPSAPMALHAGTGTLAVRVPDSRIAIDLARLFGPLVSTSANLAGEPPCRTAGEAEAACRRGSESTLAAVIDAGALDGLPSTIVDLTQTVGPPRLARAGRIPWNEVLAALERG